MNHWSSIRERGMRCWGGRLPRLVPCHVGGEDCKRLELMRSRYGRVAVGFVHGTRLDRVEYPAHSYRHKIDYNKVIIEPKISIMTRIKQG